MPTVLRTLAVLVFVVSVGVAAGAGWLFVSDAHFQEVAAAYERHPEHPIFRTDYWAAAARHYGLLTAAVGGSLGGATLGGVLLALAELLRRVPPRR